MPELEHLSKVRIDATCRHAMREGAVSVQAHRRLHNGASPHRGRANGQALVECLVISSAVLVVFLAVPMLAKYQDIRLAATAASRTLAFECTVRFEECGDGTRLAALQSDIRDRHFARHDAPVLSVAREEMNGGARRVGDGSAPGGGRNDEHNAFWRDRKARPMLNRFVDVSQQVNVETVDAVKGVLDKAGGIVRFSSKLAGPHAFGLEIDKGLLTTQVRARVSVGRTLHDWLRKPDGIELALGGRTAVLVDGWNAVEATGKDARSFESRVNLGRRLPGLLGDSGGGNGGGHGGSTELLLDTLYAPVRIEMGNFLYSPLEPMGLRFRYHQIDVDVLPEDRVGTLKK